MTDEEEFTREGVPTKFRDNVVLLGGGGGGGVVAGVLLNVDVGVGGDGEPKHNLT